MRYAPYLQTAICCAMSLACAGRTEGTAAPADTVFSIGIYNVSVKAGYDDQRIYFLLQWADSTENRTRDRWEFGDTGFARVLGMKEDMASLAFNIEGSFKAFPVAGCAAACHVAERLGQV